MDGVDIEFQKIIDEAVVLGGEGDME